MDQDAVDAKLSENWIVSQGGKKNEVPIGAASGAAYNYVQETVDGLRATTAAATVEELESYGKRAWRPGLVQPHGVCLLLSLTADASSATVITTSTNSLEIVGVTPDEILGSDLLAEDGLLSSESIIALRRALALSPDLHTANPVPLSVRGTGGTFDGILHISPEGVLLDLEPCDPNAASRLAPGLSMARHAVERIQQIQATDEPRLCQALCEEVSALTGYARVMCYRFHEDAHGEVVAECLRPEANLQPMRGLHFPATDIPHAMRQIFETQRSRCIVDALSVPARLVQAPQLGALPIQTSGSELRGVAGCHSQYLTNMGSRGTLTLALVVRTLETRPSDEGSAAAGREDLARTPRLWGLCCCHDPAPRRTSYSVRIGGEFLAQIFGLQLSSAHDAHLRERFERISSIQTAVFDTVTRLSGVAFKAVAASVMTIKPGLLELALANGCVIVSGDDVWRLGLAPTDAQVQALTKWIVGMAPSGAFATSSLNEHGYGEAAALRATCAGVLARRIDRSRPSEDGSVSGKSSGKSAPSSDIWIIWFRTEAVQEQTWAGHLSQPQGRLEGCEMMPRQSFEAYAQLVEMRCKTWALAEVEAAEGLRLLLGQALLLGAESSLSTSLLVQMNQTRLRSYDSLKSVAAELNSVVQSANQPVMAVDMAGCITEWNLKTCELTGYNRRDVMGRRLADLLSQGGFAAEAAMQAALAGRSAPLELIFRHASSGAEVALSASLTPRRNSAGGPLLGLIMVGQDITQQRLLMDECARVTGDFSMLISKAPSPVFGIDAHGLINAWNPAMEAVSTIPSSAVMGRKLVGEVFGTTLKVTTEQQTLLEAELVNALGGGLPDPLPLMVRVPDGRAVDLVVSVQPRRDGDGATVVGVFCFAQDVSLRRAMETATKVRQAAEAAAEAKTRQLSVLCHEIRNPLNGIMGNVASLEDEILDPSLVTVIGTTMSCVHQLRRTVDDMLDMSKLEDGKLSIVRRIFSVRNMVEAVVSQIGHAAADKGLMVTTDMTGCGAEMLVGDDCRIQQIIANFAWNACKFTESGDLTIRVEATPPRAPLGGDGAPPSARFFSCRFKVVDTGCGMDKDVQARLFEPWASYELANPGNNSKFGGSGLGLSICRSLATLMNGRVYCTSEPGKGSCFVLELDLEEGTAARRRSDTGILRRTSIQRTDADLPSTEPLVAWIPDADAPALEKGVTSDVLASMFARDQATGEPASKRLRMSMESAGKDRNIVHYQRASSYGDYAIKRMSSNLDRQGSDKGRTSSSTTVVREVVTDEEVAVLVEARVAGGRSTQCWGVALRSPGTRLGEALTVATDDAIAKCLKQLEAQGAGAGGATSAAATAAAAAAPAAAAAAPARPQNLLLRAFVADDEALNRKLFERWLGKNGVTLVSGDDGKDVLEHCIAKEGQEQPQFDVLLLDENMRHMNGSVACAQLRRHEREQGLQPVAALVCSGNTELEDYKAYAAAGFDGAIAKPLDMKALYDDLTAFLAARAAGTAGRAGSQWAALGMKPSQVHLAADQSRRFGSLEAFPPPPGTK